MKPIVAGVQMILLDLLVMLGGCGYHGSQGGIQASERLACQKALPTEQAECLERARTGTVIHMPRGPIRPSAHAR